MLEALPLGSTPVLTMRSPDPGTAVSKVGFEVPPQTTALVTTHWPFLVESTSCQPSRFLPFRRGLQPVSNRNGGSPCPLPSFKGGRSWAANNIANTPVATVANTAPSKEVFKQVSLKSLAL